MTSLQNARPIAFILTRDVAALKPFYAQVMGLPLIGEDPYAATFDLGGGATMRLTLVADCEPSAHTVLGWAVTDLDAVLDRLEEAGVRCESYEGLGQDGRGIWSSPDGATKVVWFKDPAGNVLSLTQFG